MAHKDDYGYYIESGCKDASHSLGIHQMPEGYALMLDADGMYFFWIEKATGRTSCIHWDKWAVYRGAKDDRKRMAGTHRYTGVTTMSDLTPPDFEQCQAYPNVARCSPLSFGPRPTPVRCTNKPVWLAVQTLKGEDGQYGSMTVCQPCADLMMSSKAMRASVQLQPILRASNSGHDEPLPWYSERLTPMGAWSPQLTPERPSDRSNEGRRYTLRRVRQIDMEWQPIETAPRDADILVWFDHNADPYQDPHNPNRITDYAVWAEGGDFLAGKGIAVARHFPEHWENTDEYGSGYWMPECWFARENSDYERAVHATHWMPLPPPPEQNKPGT